MPALRAGAGSAGELMARTGPKGYALLGGVALAVFILDQLTKAAVLAKIGPYQTLAIIPGFFDLVNVRNRGAAFGFLNTPEIEWQFWLFLAATLAAVWAIFVLARQAGGEPLLLAGLGLILGGAAGNLVDRICYRYVVDFLDFYWGSWHWPAFNVADMGICAGVFLACLASWVKRKPESAGL